MAAAGFRGLVETLVSVWALRPIPFLRECVLERVKGIEPSFLAWEADVLPLNYTRINDFVQAPEHCARSDDESYEAVDSCNGLIH